MRHGPAAEGGTDLLHHLQDDSGAPLQDGLLQEVHHGAGDQDLQSAVYYVPAGAGMPHQGSEVPEVHDGEHGENVHGAVCDVQDGAARSGPLRAAYDLQMGTVLRDLQGMPADSDLPADLVDEL